MLEDLNVAQDSLLWSLLCLVMTPSPYEMFSNFLNPLNLHLNYNDTLAIPHLVNLDEAAYEELVSIHGSIHWISSWFMLMSLGWCLSKHGSIHGIVLETVEDHKFQWPQNDLNSKLLTCNVFT